MALTPHSSIGVNSASASLRRAVKAQPPGAPPIARGPRDRLVERRLSVLIADNDIVVGQMMATFLGAQDFDVLLATTRAELFSLLACEAVDLVVTSAILADGEALDILRGDDAARRPAVIVVSEAAEAADRIVALELGADDFVAKPYNPREIVARIRAVLRGRAMAVPYDWSIRYRFSNLTFNVARSDVSTPTGASAKLTVGEATLLSFMLAAPRTPLDRATLGAAFANLEPLNARAVDVRVSRLRRKLSRLGAGRLIRTDYRRGYALAADVVRF